MKHAYLIPTILALLTACDDYVPRDKTVQYDPAEQRLVYPHPCPDWSHNPVVNYDNSLHSNYGCAVNTNLAVQLEDPRDLHRGSGDAGPDAEITTHVITRYRAGEIPAPLEPQQDIEE